MHLIVRVRFFAVGLIWFGLAGVFASAQPLSVELRWDPNSEPNLAGYNIYRSSQPGTGYYRVNSSLLQQTRFLDESLSAGYTYYYVCTAVNSVGLESGFSNEVSYQAPGPDPGDYPPPDPDPGDPGNPPPPDPDSGDPGNLPPVPEPDSAVTAEGVAVLINVTFNDLDPEGDLLSVVNVTKPVNGHTEIHDKATVRYTPPQQFEGTEQFDYFVSDGTVTAKGTVTVEVTAKELTRRLLIFPTGIDLGDPLFENTYVGIGLLNPGIQSTSISLSAHDYEGAEIVDIQLGETLRPSGQAAFITSEVLSEYTDSATVAVAGVTGPLIGFFMMGDFDLGRLDGVGAELPAATDLYLPNVKSTESETTLIQIINREKDSEAKISMALFSPDGSLVKEVNAELSPSGSVSGTVPEFFGDDLLFETAYVQIQSDVSVSGFAVVASEYSLSALAARPGATARVLVAPQFLIDQHNASTSILRLLNTDDRTVRIRVRAFDDEASLLTSTELFVSPGEMWVKDLMDLFEEVPSGLVTGYLEVEVQGVVGAASSIASSITYSTFGGQTSSTLPLLETGWRNAIFPHVAQTSDGSIYTGFSLLNLEDSKANVAIEAFDQDGRRRALKRFTLEPRTRAIDLLRSETFFGNSFEQIKGHIRIRSTRDLMIFAIFGDAQGRFMSTIEGQKPPN